jgi:hypothetical protein
MQVLTIDTFDDSEQINNLGRLTSALGAESGRAANRLQEQLKYVKGSNRL